MDYRPSRVNLDGLSKTETRVCATDVLPGTALKIVAGKFVQAVAADAGVVPLYVANVGHLQGLGANDPIPAGDSIEGEYMDPARRLALRGIAGEVWVKDAALTLSATGGTFELAVATGTPLTMPPVVAYAQENFTLPATGNNHLALAQVK